ncbi:MAG: dihydrodipicolinate reductase C-terminal domain-containing protein [Bdellovibrionales bacterium]
MNFLMSGSTGRMGKNIVALAEAEGIGQMTYGWSRSATGDRTIQSLEEADPNQVDVVIDFSLPMAFEKALAWAEKHKKPFFSGTTGLAEVHFPKLESASKEIPVLWAPNTSLGINFLNEMIKMLGTLKGFDFQIIEAHHNQKKDAPSGTALFLQDTLNKHADVGIPEPLAIRGGGIYGEHEILAMAKDEVISVKTHRSNARRFCPWGH